MCVVWCVLCVCVCACVCVCVCACACVCCSSTQVSGVGPGVLYDSTTAADARDPRDTSSVIFLLCLLIVWKRTKDTEHTLTHYTCTRYNFTTLSSSCLQNSTAFQSQAAFAQAELKAISILLNWLIQKIHVFEVIQ